MHLGLMILAALSPMTIGSHWLFSRASRWLRCGPQDTHASFYSDDSAKDIINDKVIGLSIAKVSRLIVTFFPKQRIIECHWSLSVCYFIVIRLINS